MPLNTPLRDLISHIGKYEIRSLLGEGAMGTVYLAEDPHIQRRVAIKLMKAAGADDGQRFLHEARIVGSLSHPNIVVLHDFGFHEDRPYLVFEYLSGTSLDVWLKAAHSLPEHLSIIEDLVSALSYAHARGVLHRDVKPSNIQVMPDGSGKLMDFGIARAPAAKLTAEGTIMGTPSYMAPEIVEDAQYSPRADLYSTAVVVYEMLGGGNPFLGQNLAATLHNVITLDPPPLVDLRPGLPAELSNAVAACLAKPPDKRPHDLSDLLAVVRRLRSTAAAVDTILLAPQPQLTRTLVALKSTKRRRRTLRRRILLVAGGTAAVGALLWSLRRPEPAAPPVIPAPRVETAAPSAAATVIPPRPATPRPALHAPATAHLRVRPAERRPLPAPAVHSAAPSVAIAPTTAPKERAPQAAPSAAIATMVTAAPRPELPPAVLSDIRPRSGRRGLLVSVELRGSALRPEHKAEILRGRQPAAALHVTHQTFVDSTLVRATLLIDEDAPIGLYSVAVADESGRFSNNVLFEVIL